MKKLAATLFATMGMAVVPVAMAPVAGADACRRRWTSFLGGWLHQHRGRRCRGGHRIVQHVPYVPRNTCYTVQGVPTTRLLANPAELEVEQRQFWCLDELA